MSQRALERRKPGKFVWQNGCSIMLVGVENMESNAAHVPPSAVSDLVARARPFEPDPPAVEGTCGRCGYRGPVYAGRYGGHRCAVCFGLQTGWMPRGEL